MPAKGYLVPIQKRSFCPISTLCSKFYPRNINYMPAVKFFACLDLEQKSSFLDGHYLTWKPPLETPMSLHIIIDGYNLIRQSDTLSAFDRQDIQLGREALLDALATYKRIKGHRITVVFDGTNAPSFSSAKDRFKGVNIVFSRSGELADAVIKRMAKKEKEKALIVTSDRDVINFAEAQGSAYIHSPMFEQKIAMASSMDVRGLDTEDNAIGGWVPSTKKKGPRRRLSKKDRHSRIKIRKL